jgi:hypothetical protein
MKQAGQIDCVVCPVLAKKLIEEVKEKIFAEKMAIIRQKAAAQRKAEQESMALAKAQEEQAVAKQKAEASAKIEAEEDEAAERAPEETFLREPNGKEESGTIVSKKSIDSPRSPSSVAAAFVCGDTTHIMPPSPETTPAITPMPADEALVLLPEEEEPDVTLADDVEGIELSLSQHIRKMETLGETAARMAILPPRPVDCDLLEPMEDEDQGESYVESDEVLQKYRIR